MATAKRDAALSQLVQTIDEAFHCRSWHGTNLRGSIRRVNAEQAGWRLRPGGHTIAQITLHAAYWKYSARRRLRGDKRGSFPLKGSDWFDLPEPLLDADWKAHVALLDDQHRQLREAVAVLSPAKLHRKPPGGKVSFGMLIRGVALHDIYHAGQIQMIKAAQKAASMARNT